MRGMNILLSIAITTGILSGIWGWVAVALGLLCIQAKQVLLSFVPGTFIGACATFAGQGDWKLVLPSLAVGLLFGYAMKNSGLWLAARRERHSTRTVAENKKA